jgi:alkylhydroperoxidase family enzyme
MGEKEPRLPLRSSHDSEGDNQRILSKLEKSGKVWTILRMLANSPNAFRPRVQLADALLHRSAIPRTITETAILRSAKLVDGHYEWEQHAATAERYGINDEALRAIAEGDVTSSVLSDEQKIVIRFCNELVQVRDVSADTWSSAKSQWGTEGVCDLLITVAYWAGFTSMIAAGLRLEIGD